MASKLTQQQLPPRTIVILLATVCIIIGIVEVKSLEAKEHAENPPQVIDGNTCFKCHNTPEELQKLRRKEGSAEFLFNKDGTPHNPEIVEFYRKQGFTYKGPSPHGSSYTK